jgi:eukaryotic-like serine/threonine-protein kinase
VDAEISHGATEECDDNVAEQAASFDEALAAGRGSSPVPAGDAEGISALLAAQASLRMLERVWPRSPKVENPEPGIPSSSTAVFGRFQIIRELGQGGFGVVFLAIDPELDRPVALKLPRGDVLLDPESRKRFVREARAVANLDHPNIVPLFEAGEVGPVCYLASAYCEGPTLAAWLRQHGGAVPPRLAAKILNSLADAMQHAHERGVLHRDLKPSNILLHRSRSVGPEVGPAAPGLRSSDGRDQEIRAQREAAGDDPAVVARIIDFGLARLMHRPSEEATASFAVMGSAPYMAPEQVEGKKVGLATDVYGLGTILYSMLCRRPPHHGANDPDTLRRVVADELVPPRRRCPEIPRDLEAICLKCLEKDPARRYPSARELASDLDRFLNGEPTRARPPGWSETIRRKARRHPAGLVILAVVAACVMVLLAGRAMYEARMDVARRLSQQKDDQTRARESENQRHLLYVSDIRRADQLLRASRAQLAEETLLQHCPRAEENDLREFAWYHLLRQCHTERRTLGRHRGDVYYVEFSPRGDLLASAGKDGIVQVWSTTSWQLVRSITASQTEVNVAAFSPDGKTLATVDDDGKLKLWEVATGRCQWEKLAHEGDAVIARFTPDGRGIIAGGRKDGFIRIWDRASGVMMDALPGNGHFFENAVFASDGAMLATAGREGVKLWDWSRRALIAMLPESRGSQGLAFSRDGKKLATTHEEYEGPVRLWNVYDGRLIREFKGHTNGAFSVAFTPDDQTMISADGDGTIRLWSVADGLPRGCHRGHTGRIWNLALSPDGRTVASAGQDGTVKLWDSDPPLELPKFPFESRAKDYVFLQDGRTLMTLEYGHSQFISRWGVSSGSLVERRPINLPDSVHWQAFSPDGQILACVNEEHRLSLWSTTTGLRHGVLDFEVEHHTPRFSPDGRYLSLTFRSLKWSIWDLANRCLIPAPRDEADFAGFTPSGEVVVVDHDGTVHRWNPGTGRLRTPSSRRVYRTWIAAVSADGRTLATLDPLSKKIHLWSAETLELHKELPGHPIGTAGMAFTPDGKTFASAGFDRILKLWDVATGEELLRFEGFPGTVCQPWFSRDGRALAALALCSAGSEVFLWRTTGNELPTSKLGEGMRPAR